MSKKRVLVVDAHNVITVLRRLGVSFEEISGLGCHFKGEPGLKVTPELIAAWYEEEKDAIGYLRL